MTIHEVTELVGSVTGLVIAVGGLVAVLRGLRQNRGAIAAVQADVKHIKENGGK